MTAEICGQARNDIYTDDNTYNKQNSSTLEFTSESLQ